MSRKKKEHITFDQVRRPQKGNRFLKGKSTENSKSKKGNMPMKEERGTPMNDL